MNASTQRPSDVFGSNCPTWIALLLRIVTCAAISIGGLVALTAHGGPPPPQSAGGHAPTETPGYNIPGRNPSSQMPWELFLGSAAHRMIAYIYKVDHPRNRVYFNSKTLVEILTGYQPGDPSLLLPGERTLKPDITDLDAQHLFEIKPWNTRGLQEGQQEAQLYLTALNRAVPATRRFAPGTGIQREILIRFAQGQYIWRLEWQTTVPGVIQYRWTRSQQAFASERAAYQAGQWVEISEQEMRQYGGWVEQAVEGMVNRREQIASISGAMGLVIDVAGTVAVGVLSGSIFSQIGSGPQRSTGQGGQVTPLPSRTSPPAPPPRLPAASGM